MNEDTLKKEMAEMEKGIQMVVKFRMKCNDEHMTVLASNTKINEMEKGGKDRLSNAYRLPNIHVGSKIQYVKKRTCVSIKHKSD